LELTSRDALSPLWFGWNEDLDIPSALALGGDHGIYETVALVSTIDSGRNVAGMPSLIPKLEQGGHPHTLLEEDVAVGMATLLTLIRDDFFFGFDEIWIFRTTPERATPRDVRLTSDQPLIEVSVALRNWMVESGCVAGLGDGCGLNFATFDPGLHRMWRSS
jgi:hypothetical protein